MAGLGSPTFPSGSGGGGGGSSSITSLLGITSSGQKNMAGSLSVAIASDQSTLPVAGTLTNNNAAPSTNNIGVLGAIANAAVPSYTEGDLVLHSVDLSGYMRVKGSSPTGSTVPANAFYMGMVSASSNLQGLTAGNNIGDAGNATGNLAIAGYIYNGTNWDRMRSASGAQGTTGTGLLGAAALGWDGTNYQRATVNSTTTSSKFGLDNNILSVLGTAPTTAGMVNVGGLVATNVAITDNPVNIGVQAITSENTAVTATRKAQLVSDVTGRLITFPFANKENLVSGIATATGTTDTAVIAAQGSGLYIYITSISVVNTGATSVLVTIETDTASAKTAIWYLIAPAGGGQSFTFTTPIKGSVTNKNVGFVAGGSTTTLQVSIAGYAGT